MKDYPEDKPAFSDDEDTKGPAKQNKKDPKTVKKVVEGKQPANKSPNQNNNHAWI